MNKYRIIEETRKKGSFSDKILYDTIIKIQRKVRFLFWEYWSDLQFQSGESLSSPMTVPSIDAADEALKNLCKIDKIKILREYSSADLN